jgi:hypothetical protein
MGVTYTSFIAANPNLATWPTNQYLNVASVCIPYYSNSVTAVTYPSFQTVTIPTVTYPSFTFQTVTIPTATYPSYTWPTVTMASTTAFSYVSSSCGTSGFNYVVGSADSCASLISTYVSTNPSLFYSANPTINCNSLTIGQLICVPGYYGVVNPSSGTSSAAATCTNYAIRTGDTCTSLVNTYTSTNPTAFYTANPYLNCQSLQVHTTNFCLKRRFRISMQIRLPEIFLKIITFSQNIFHLHLIERSAPANKFFY